MFLQFSHGLPAAFGATDWGAAHNAMINQVDVVGLAFFRNLMGEPVAWNVKRFPGESVVIGHCFPQQ